MARFVESAVLQIIDQSTGPINKVRASLRALDRTAKSIKGKDLKFNLQASSGNIAAITGQVIRLQSALTGAVTKANQLASALRAAGGIRMPPVPNQSGPSRSPGPGGHNGRNRIRDYAGYYAVSRGFNTAGRVTSAGGTGILDADADRMQALQRNLPKNIQAAIDAAAKNVSSEYRALTPSMINSIVRDAVPNLNEANQKPENMVGIARIVANAMTADLIRTKGDTNRALENNRAGVKFADALGMGDTPARFKQALETFSRILVAGGDDLKAQSVLAGFRGAKTAAYSASPGALIRMGLMFDETGRQGGNEWAQFIESFAGNNITKKALAYQKKMGLRSKDGGAIDEALLRSDTDKWMVKHIGNLLKARGAKFDGSDEDNAKIAKMATEFGVRQTAMNFLTREMVKHDERLRAEEKARRVNLTPEFNKGYTGTSVGGSITAMEAQFKAAVDRLTQSMQGPFTSAIDAIAQKLAKVKEEGLSAGDYAVGGAAFAGAAALAIGKALADNPGATAMGVAAAAHLRAAAALSTAAALLGGKGAVPPVVGGPGKVGRLGRLVRGAGAVGAGLVMADLTIGVVKQLSDDNHSSNLRHRKTISSQDLGLKWENPSDRDAILKLAKEATDRFRRDPEGARGEAFAKLADAAKIKDSIGEGMSSGVMKLKDGMDTAASAAADKIGEGMTSGAVKIGEGLTSGASAAGDIMASKIKEAAANININVNTSGGGTNTGTNTKGGK